MMARWPGRIPSGTVSNDIAISNLWILEPMTKQVYPLLFSVGKEGLILLGGDEPGSASVEIPFGQD